MRVERARTSLKSKGFVEKTKGDHYRFFFYYNGKKTSIHTKFSHGRQIPPYILNKVRHQICLTKRGQLEGFLSCDMLEEEYQCILRQLGRIS